MSGNLIPIIIVPVIFFSMVAVVKIISDNVVRRKLIEKGAVDENVKYLFTSSSTAVPASLKWGMALIAIGSAILIGQIVPYSIQEEVTISGIFIMPGLALIVYYFMAQKMSKDSE